MKETPAKNLATQQKHQHEVFWQITFPLIVGGLLLAVVCILPFNVVFGQGGEVGTWRDISLIWIILPLMVIALIPLALIGGLVYGVTRLLGITPGYMLQLQAIFEKIAATTEQISQKTRLPFDKIRAVSRRIRRSLE